jgi:hypothetical protein
VIARFLRKTFQIFVLILLLPMLLIRVGSRLCVHKIREWRNNKMNLWDVFLHIMYSTYVAKKRIMLCFRIYLQFYFFKFV